MLRYADFSSSGGWCCETGCTLLADRAVARLACLTPWGLLCDSDRRRMAVFIWVTGMQRSIWLGRGCMCIRSKHICQCMTLPGCVCQC